MQDPDLLLARNFPSGGLEAEGLLLTFFCLGGLAALMGIAFELVDGSGAKREGMIDEDVVRSRGSKTRFELEVNNARLEKFARSKVGALRSCDERRLCEHGGSEQPFEQHNIVLLMFLKCYCSRSSNKRCRSLLSRCRLAK